MQVRAGFEISIRCNAPTPLVGMLDVHPSRTADLLSPATLRTDHDLPVRRFTDAFGNTCLRTMVPAGVLTLQTDFVIDDASLPPLPPPETPETPVEFLPDDVLPFLYGSRYCETDKLSPVAWSLFGDTPRGLARVEAIVAHVSNHVEFGYEFASPTLSAWDTYRERRGVARDFVHLAVAFCRNMNVPARYCTGYVPSLARETDDAPMDFSAWMEAYLDGRWYAFDPRHGAPRPGRIALAHGRDAADVAIYTTFGPSSLERFHVFAFQVSGETR
jgi:transglutaminase-like putative cysteine protease